MRHQDYLDVSAASDRASFERSLVHFAHNLGFDIATAVLAVDKPGQKPVFITIGNTPDAFLQASRDDTAAKRDPVLTRLKQMSMPFVYDQSTYVSSNAGDLWEEQAAYGFHTGISMALHMPEGRHFILGVDRAQPLPPSDDVVTRMMADLQLLAVYAQETAVRVLLPEDEPRGPKPHLTPREREVLAWTREGKSAWAVGQILSMSEHTVNYHLRNVMKKLDVSSKHLAILRALSLGLF